MSSEADLDRLAEHARQQRRTLGQPAARWTTPCIRQALHTALQHRGWPPDQAARALVGVAADPHTRSPMRLAEAGPWWDEPPPGTDSTPEDEQRLAQLEARLDATDGHRVHLQRQARQQLSREGIPLTRRSVLTRASQLLDTALVRADEQLS